jgi:hypothetical protein
LHKGQADRELTLSWVWCITFFLGIWDCLGYLAWTIRILLHIGILHTSLPTYLLYVSNVAYPLDAHMNAYIHFIHSNPARSHFISLPVFVHAQISNRWEAIVYLTSSTGRPFHNPTYSARHERKTSSHRHPTETLLFGRAL